MESKGFRQLVEHLEINIALIFKIERGNRGN